MSLDPRPLGPSELDRGAQGATTPRAAVYASILLVVLLFLPYLFPFGRGYPWDFETYYYAASAALQGLNPYDTANLVALAKRPVGMPFVYPPVTLLLFAPFTWLPVHAADVIWIGIKTLLAVWLLQLWLKRFLECTDAIVLSIVMAMGFNSAMFWDLKLGNVAILEALLLWWGFAFYLRDRRVAFTVLVTLASVFKIVPIALLALLVVPSKREPARPTLLICGLAALAGIVLGPLLVGPSWAGEYLRHLPSERPTGIVNPCALGIFDTLLGNRGPDSAGGSYLPVAMWAVYCAALMGVSWPTVRRIWRARDPEQWVPASVFLLVLLSPRPMIYSYIMLIPPAMKLGTPLLERVGGHLAVAALLIAPAVGGWLGIIRRSFGTDNYPFFVALGLWLLFLARERGSARLRTA